MRNYIRSVLMISTVFSVLEVAYPLRKNSFLPYIKFIMGLVLVLVIIVPFVTSIIRSGEILTYIKEIFVSKDVAGEDTTKETVLRETAFQLASSIADILYEQYGISKKSVTVDVTLDVADIQKVRVKSVSIHTKELPPLLTSAYLSSYFSELLGCDVSVD